MALDAAPRPQAPQASKELKRSIGFFGLMFISLGSIIGAGRIWIEKEKDLNLPG